MLAGFVPGVTATVSSVSPPAATLFGLAEPTPVGEVGPLQRCAGELALRGAGVAAGPKSAPLSSVSVQPPSSRKSASVLPNVGAALAPSKKFAPPVPVPKPTRSTIWASCAGEQGADPPLQATLEAVFATMTLPAVADMFVVPVAWAAGSGAPLAVPPASLTR